MLLGLQNARRIVRRPPFGDAQILRNGVCRVVSGTAGCVPSGMGASPAHVELLDGRAEPRCTRPWAVVVQLLRAGLSLADVAAHEVREILFDILGRVVETRD